ncbi:MAG: DUF1318 domain-containing protein [Phycisphaera sp.]|nr:DUF1318 domain-containing protein [Phycisphaera sp.]
MNTRTDPIKDGHTMKRSTFLVTMLALAAMPLALTRTARGDELDTLKQRFQERYNALQQAKSAGTIGETAAGYVEAVKGADGATAQLLNAENGDRQKLYQILAQKAGTTADVVAAQNAQRNFQRARSGEYLKGKDGRWYRKQ